MSIQITFPDGAVKPFDAGITALAIAQGMAPRLAAAMVGYGLLLALVTLAVKSWVEWRMSAELAAQASGFQESGPTPAPNSLEEKQA